MNESVTPLSPSAIYKRLLSYLKPYSFVFFLTIVANLIFAAIEASFIQLTKNLVDQGLLENDHSVLDYAPIVFLLMVIARSIVSFFAIYGLDWLGRQLIKSIRSELFQHYLYLPARFFDAHASGDLIAKMTYNSERLAGSVTNGISHLLKQGSAVVITLGLMFYNNWKLASIFIISGPLIGYVANIATKRFRKISDRIQASMGGVTQITSEAINGFKVIRTYRGADYEAARFEQVNESNRKQYMKFVATKAISVPLVQIIAAIGVSGVIAYSAYMIKTEELTPGEFVAIMLLMLYILKPLKQLTTINSTIQEGIAAVKDIFDILDSPLEKQQQGKPLSAVQGEVKLENVSFSYNDDHRLALRNVSLTIRAGQTVALVGRSGSGKSTITDLLLGFYSVQQGHIYLDGEELTDINLPSLRDHIAVVSQDVVLFNDTVRNNIAYAKQGVEEKDIVEAAKAAHALEFIENLPDKWDTMIGEDGALLSGGQKQRLAIARAFLKNAPILILDEATSALDTESEREIQRVLEKLMQNKTTIIVAHRLSTIEKAKQIFVLDSGELKEQGTHAELLAKQGYYANLHQVQQLD